MYLYDKNGKPYIHIFCEEYCLECDNWTRFIPESKYRKVCSVCGYVEEREPTLWDLVCDYREEAKMSKAELARRVGVSASTIYRIEDRRTIPKEATVVKLAEVLGADKDLFLKERERLIEAQKLWND